MTDLPLPAESGPLFRLELTTFGAPTARLDGRLPPPDVLWRKHLALLIYLALSPNLTRTRAHLTGLLWPEKDETKARHSLNEGLRRLRLSLGAPRLLTRTETISLEPKELTVDALQPWRPTADGPVRSRGVFLDGFTVDDEASGFDEWAEVERARFRDQDVRVLVTLGQDLLARGRTIEGRDAARQALAVQPYAEPAARLALRAAALSGDATGALAEYHAFTSGLERLGEAPSRELEMLAQRIRDGRWREVLGRQGVDEPPLVGRSGVQRSLARWLSGTSRTASTVLISGEPGIGKTRVLTEQLARLALEGATVVLVRPLEDDQVSGWSTLRAILRRGLLAAPGVAATDPHHLALLISLVPELDPGAAGRTPREQGEVALALATLLHAVAEDGPIVVAIDQAHFADGPTLRALHAAMESLKDVPVSLVLTLAPGDPDTPRELLQLLADIGRSLAGAAIALQPLDYAGVSQLVSALAPWCVGLTERDRLTRRVLFESGGRPLMVVTLLRGLSESESLRDRAVAWPPPNATFESPLPMAVPQLVQSALLAQIARVGRKAREVLAAASIGAQVLDLPLVSELCELPVPELVEPLAQLERHHLITAVGEHYAFATPLIAQIVSEGMVTPGQVRDLRSRAVEILSGRRDLVARALCAELRARVTPGRAAVREALNVAREALAAGDRRTSRRSLAVLEIPDTDLSADDRAAVENLRQRLSK